MQFFFLLEYIKGKLPVDQYSLVRIADPNCKEIGDAPSAIEVSSWWTNLDMSPKFIQEFKKSQKIRKNSPLNQQQSAACEHAFVAHLVDLYKDHATSEQYHSELKTDMNMELLPSHHFSTNSAYLALSAIAFNVLRVMGDIAIVADSSLQHHKTKRTKRMPRNGHREILPHYRAVRASRSQANFVCRQVRNGF